MSQVFETGVGRPTKIITVTGFDTSKERQIWHCSVFLVYNDTFVNINKSKISCSQHQGNATNFSTGKTVEAETGFIFKIGFNAKLVKGGGLEAIISRASVGKLNSFVPNRF